MLCADADLEVKAEMGAIFPAYLNFLKLLMGFLCIWFLVVGWVGFAATALKDNTKAMKANMYTVEAQCQDKFRANRYTINKEQWPRPDFY